MLKKTFLSTTFIAAVGVFSLPVCAQGIAPFSLADSGRLAPAAAAVGTASTSLRRFAASQQDLLLSGERAMTNIAFFVTAAETAQPARLNIVYQTAVSVLPQTSSMQVFVNDRSVSETKLRAGPANSLVLEIPSGMLQPGYNSIGIAVDQHHRVDCSLSGTYELWTQVDAARSGIDFALPDLGPISLADLPVVARSGTDHTAINVVLPEGTSNRLKSLALSAVQAVSILGSFKHPLVTFSKTAGTGPGIDIFFGEGAAARAIGAGTGLPGVSLIKPDPTGRAGLVLGTQAAPDIASAVTALVSAAQSSRASGTIFGLKALGRPEQAEFPLATAVSLREFGLDTQEFSGRMYRSEMSFFLPTDFYPADYDTARLKLNAAYAAGLSTDAQLLVKANGHQVAVLSLNAPGGAQLTDQVLKIPLGNLRPGRNTISFEASLLKNTDATCDPAEAADLDPRFVIRESSTLRVPQVGRMGHLPDLGAIANAGTADAAVGASLTLLTPVSDGPSFDAAATILALSARSSRTVRTTRLSSTVPPTTSGDLLAVGTFKDLPPELLAHTGVNEPGMLQLGSSEPEPTRGGQPEAKTLAVREASFFTSFATPMDVSTRVAELLNNSVLWARRTVVIDGIGDSSTFTAIQGYQPDRSARVILAQAATPGSQPHAWSVVAAPDEAALSQGIALLSGGSGWDRLSGAVGTVDDKGDVETFAANRERLFETQPRSLTNLRLVFAGWLSRHVQTYMISILLLALLLGVSTHLFLRQLGNTKR
ncbi:MAG: cellulose biosynthesis cyclic di-GMP-binding regulatory protein BcsB [Pseudomonadota bacterium]|nr:cellulose biosynthesis cyclic di-GMP-binding regulatory protein BcsB [Pseudomonadota bacterium]